VTSRDFQDRLTRRAKRAGVAISAALANRLETYYRLLAIWNQKINLSGIDLSEASTEALDRLLVEPLVAAKYVRPGTNLMIDIGSGGGSPAIPFALAVPGSRLLMVESKTRKSVFLKEAVRALELNGEVLTSRFEALLSRPELHETHDLLTIRAVRMESRILMNLQAFVKPGGHLFLFRSGGGDAPDSMMPPLTWVATFPLVEPLRSRLVIIQKRQAAQR
jgi:16S rRNA (guanine527-N7)-methyltransferase